MADDRGTGGDPHSWVEVDDGDTTWRFERAFLESRWTCLWGRGCVGILAAPAEALDQGCCSLGADLDGDDEAMLVSAMAAMVPAELFEQAGAAADGGIFADDSRSATRVVDGACIFFNRPGFSGGHGCALHLAAIDADESPKDWKPSVCWQLPIHVDFVADGAPGADPDHEVATVRRWSRADWGVHGQEMAWCCTEGELAYVGDRPVIESLAGELEAITGPEVFVELRRRLADG